MDEALSELALAIEQELEWQGWDRPAALYQVALGTEAPDDELISPTGDDDFDALVAGLGVSLGVEQEREIDGQPFDELVGYVADPEAIGLAFSVEGWSYSPADQELIRQGAELPSPSATEGRVEVRMVTVVLRDGTEKLVWRRRGEEPHVVDSIDEGRIAGALRRALGLPSRMDFDTDVRAVARGWWFCVASHMLLAISADIGELPADIAGAPDHIEMLAAGMMTMPAQVLLSTGFPQTALAEAVSSQQALSWTEVLGFARSLPPESGGEIFAWADEGMLASELLGEPNVAKAADRLHRGGISSEIIDGMAFLLDPDVPFPDVSDLIGDEADEW